MKRPERNYWNDNPNSTIGWCDADEVDTYIDKQSLQLSEALKALRRFESLKEAVEKSYLDETIIRCEMTAGDIRAVISVIEKLEGGE